MGTCFGWDTELWLDDAQEGGCPVGAKYKNRATTEGAQFSQMKCQGVQIWVEGTHIRRENLGSKGCEVGID